MSRWLAPILVLGLLLPLWAVQAGAQGDPTPDPTETSTPDPTETPTPSPTPTEEPTPSPTPTEEPTPTPTEDPCVADPSGEGCEPDCEADPEAEGCQPDCEADPEAEGCQPDCEADPEAEGCQPDCEADPEAEGCQPDCEADPEAEGCQPDCEADPEAEGCEPDCEADPEAEGCQPDCEADPEAEGCEPEEEETEDPDKPDTGEENTESLSLEDIESGSEVELPPAGRSPDTGYVVINGILRSPAAVSGLLTQLGEIAAREADALAWLREAVKGQPANDRSAKDLKKTEKRFAELKATENELKQQLVVFQQMYDEIEEALAGQEDERIEQAIEAYIGGSSRATQPGMVLTVEDPRLGVVVGEYVKAAGSRLSGGEYDEASLRGTLEALSMALDSLAEMTEEATAVRKAAKKEVNELREDLEAQLASFDDIVHALLEDVVNLRTQKNALASSLGSRDPDPIDVLSIVADALEEHEDGDRTLGLPLDGPPALVSGFGLRFHPIFLETRLHSGADLSAPYGAPIKAAGSGRVVLAESQIGYGLVVIVEHVDGISTLYSHMSGFAVGLGETVKKGDVIGFVGSTGYSTGPHLHYEVRVLGNPVDPIPYIRAAQGG